MGHEPYSFDKSVPFGFRRRYKKDGTVKTAFVGLKMRTLVEWVKARQTAYDAYHDLADETDARKIAAYIKHNTGTDIDNDIEWDDLDIFWLVKIADAANPPGGQFFSYIR
jgi:hypothetical protein